MRHDHSTRVCGLPPNDATATRGSGIPRRRFLRTAAAGVAFCAVVPRRVVIGGAEPAPSNRPNLLGVGVGGVGFDQLQACERAGFAITALCDVDDDYAKKAYDRWPDARRHRDFRKMFDAERDYDAVYVGTPDHTHAVITLAALRKKKHVCCVKPLTRTVHECRTITAAAREAGVATQVTAAPHTSEAGCRTAELIGAGAIGAVREVHVWSNRPLWPQGVLRPEGADAVPKTLDWELWIGPAPMRSFKANWPEGHYALESMKTREGLAGMFKAVYHPFNFRGWWDFGTGALGDMGCHHFNTVMRALQLEQPVQVQATATRVFPESAPLSSLVTFDFPARNALPPVRARWYDGGLKPPCPKGFARGALPDEGTLYVGDEGAMLGPQILDEERAKKYQSVPKTLPRRPGTWEEWMVACRGGEPAGCNFQWAQNLTELVLLGNIAIRCGKRLEWDGAAMRFTNEEGANRFLKEDYRTGWTL